MPRTLSKACILALLGAYACSPSEPEEEHPQRIILIVADTLRRDFLSPYGGKTWGENMQYMIAAYPRRAPELPEFIAEDVDRPYLGVMGLEIDPEPGC